MKKLLIIGLSIIAVFVLLGLGLIVFGLTRGAVIVTGDDNLDPESKKYVESTLLPSMLPVISGKAILDHMYESDRKKMAPDPGKKLSDYVLNRYGQCHSYSGLNGSSMMGIIRDKKTIGAVYFATLNCDKGSPPVRLILVKAKGSWWLRRVDMDTGFDNHIDDALSMQVLQDARNLFD